MHDISDLVFKSVCLFNMNATNVCLFRVNNNKKVNNQSQLTIKTLEQRHWHS